MCVKGGKVSAGQEKPSIRTVPEYLRVFEGWDMSIAFYLSSVNL